MLSRSFRCFATLALLLALPATALAQVPAPPTARADLFIDSGPVENTSDEWASVISFPVSVPGADWVQLEFEHIRLAGSPFDDTGSLLVITSHKDGAVQYLNRIHCEQWQNATAYMNGDAVQVEVYAAPHSGVNRVVLEGYTIGVPSTILETQCGPTDDRVASFDPRSARMAPIGCSGWMIDDCAGCFLTAGHCNSTSNIAQFNVPPSNPSGSWNNPPPEDQYARDPSSIQSQNGGIGADWAYFGMFPNSNTGLTPSEAQGAVYTLTTPPPFNASELIRITGYGTDTGTTNQIQQTSTGPWFSLAGSAIRYVTDTTGGSSGSVVLHEPTGNAIGIHCHGGCSVTGSGSNSGSTITHVGFANALANPQGLCAGGAELLTEIPDRLTPGNASTIEVQIDGGVIPETAFLHVSYDGAAFVDVPLVAGAGNVFQGTFPPPACVGDVSFYFSAQTTACTNVLLPDDAPSTTLSTVVGDPDIQEEFDMEARAGWVSGAAGDSALTGHWVRVDPIGTIAQPEDDHSPFGTDCWVTGQGAEDVDRGTTTLFSHVFDVTTLEDPWVGVWIWFSNGTGTLGGGDKLDVHVSDDAGASWTLVESIGPEIVEPGWDFHQFRIAQYVSLTTELRVRFRARDIVLESTVEAAVDDFSVFDLGCTSNLPDCNGNGIFDDDDIASGRSDDANGDTIPDECAIPGTPFCFGVGCPCGNDDANAGCTNSTGSGALLSASGSTSYAADDLSLIATNCPPDNSGLFFAGDTQLAPVFVGDGLGCAGGQSFRYLPGMVSASGVLNLSDLVASSPPGFLGSGLTRHFQAWTRDVLCGPPPAPCPTPCGANNNLTNALSVTFTP